MEPSNKFWLVAKTVVATAGVIYLLSLLSWFAHWMIVLGALGGVGYVAFKLAPGSKPQQPPKQLQTEAAYRERLAQLEAEERLLDAEVGI